MIMNNIQLLAEQVNNQAADLFSGQADGMVVTRDDLVKFADLIVKECAEFANDHNSEVEGVTLGVGQALKKHFGIDK